MDFLRRLIEKFISERLRHRRLYRITAVLACFVVFVTTYALILPAITMDKRTALVTPGVESRSLRAAAEDGDGREAGPADWAQLCSI